MTEWLSAPEYELGHTIVERGVAAVYLIAFVGARNQFRPLLGEHGLLQAPRYFARVSFRRSPGLFHLHYSDRFFAVVAWTGIATSSVLLLGGLDRAPLGLWMLAWLLQWLLYLSIVNAGQIFYSFGWESLLLEAGFVAIFLGPQPVEPSWPSLLVARWLLFRLEFGAGLIKLRGDACWRDLTCLYYHHETQPMPNALSWFFHHLPRRVHKLEVAGNHFAQLVAPFGLFAPQPVANIAAAVIVVTQFWLVLSGNFSWLNWLSIILAFAAFDDAFLEKLLDVSVSTAASPSWYTAAAAAFAVAVAILSYWPVRNMLSRAQFMNYSFNRLHLVNTYGAFGSVTRRRREIVIEGAASTTPGADIEWHEYEFRGKPGDPRRRPPQIAPYHLRLDWLLWFVPLSPRYGEDWLYGLLIKLLQNDGATLRLLRRNPFPHEPPAFVRVRLFDYRFTTRAERRAGGAWWHRTEAVELVPPLTIRDAAVLRRKSRRD